VDDLERYFKLSPTQHRQLTELQPLYTEWNARINVISRKDIDNIYSNHVLHSLSIAKFIQFTAQDRVLDAGTGGGFPGLPLAILFPETSFVLADSINKKLQVIQDIACTIGLSNIQTVHQRVEALPKGFSFVVSRAVTRLDTMWAWVSPLLTLPSGTNLQNGLLYLKGGDISAEKPNNTIVRQIPLQSLIPAPQFHEKSLVYICKN